MKLNINGERFLAAVDREGDYEAGAGYFAADPINAQSRQERVLAEGLRIEPTHLAFGRLIHLLRRQKGWSAESLAEQARIDLEEVLLIESIAEHRPEQRTVFQLAHLFELQPKSLMQLSGNAVPRKEMVQEALKFAASSEPMTKLTPEETRAVEIFVNALNSATDKKSLIP